MTSEMFSAILHDVLDEYRLREDSPLLQIQSMIRVGGTNAGLLVCLEDGIRLFVSIRDKM